MSYAITSAVQQQVRQLFPASAVSQVLFALEITPLPLLSKAPGEVERIHLAVLHLSAGDIQRFQLALGGAAQDWRDTLMGAGLANADWKQILQSRGISPSHP